LLLTQKSYILFALKAKYIHIFVKNSDLGKTPDHPRNHNAPLRTLFNIPVD